MEEVKTYLLSICGAALICAVINRFWSQKGSAAIGKMMAGLFIVLTVLQPLSGIGTEIVYDIEYSLNDLSSEAVGRGEREARTALQEIIKEKTAAYILQRSQTLQADISVDVYVSEDTVPIPVKVCIKGTIAPYAKQQLQIILEQELGISKENQIWT